MGYTSKNIPNRLCMLYIFYWTRFNVLIYKKNSIDKNGKSVYNKNRKWRNHKRGLTPLDCKKTHRNRSKLQMCFLFVYLLKIITNIIKANTIIVSTTKPNKSKYIISNNALSIICTTSNLATKVTELKVATTPAYYHFLCQIV